MINVVFSRNDAEQLFAATKLPASALSNIRTSPSLKITPPYCLCLFQGGKGGLLGLPESEYELDNLTEFNTAHNRRITMLGITDEPKRPRKVIYVTLLLTPLTFHLYPPQPQSRTPWSLPERPPSLLDFLTSVATKTPLEYLAKFYLPFYGLK